MRRTCGRVCLSLALLGGLAIAAFAQAAGTPSPTTPAPDASLPSRFAVGVVVDAKGIFQHNGADDDLQLDEVKIIASDRLSRQAEARLTLDLGEPDARLEEAYIAFRRVTPCLGARVGKALIPFGVANPVYPYRLPYADLPSAVQNLVGKEYAATGGEVIFRDGRANGIQARLGYWMDGTQDDNVLNLPSVGVADAELGAQFTDGFLLGRLSFGPDDARASGLALGASAAIGDGVLTGEIPRQRPLDPDARVTLLEADATYRKHLPGERQWLLQAAGIRRRADDGHAEHQFGYYVLAAYRPTARWELGARYDWAEAPYLYRVHESSLSAFGTRHFTPDTYGRVQFTHGQTWGDDTLNEVILQVVTAFGKAPR